MFLTRSNTPRWVIIVGDIFISLFALLFSYLIRFDLQAKEELIREEWEILSKSIGVYIVVKLIVFYIFKIHKGLMRYTSTEDMSRIFKATFFSSIIFAILGAVRAIYLDGWFLFPTSVLILEFLISTVLIVVSRFVIKLLYIDSAKSKKKNKNL